MKVNNALVTGDELNTFVVNRPNLGLSGNKCETVGEIQDNYYINIWASPWPYLASNRLPIYQWILPSSEYIASQGYTGYTIGECYFDPNYYEEYRDFYVNFTTSMPGPGQVNMVFDDSTGQSIPFSTGATSVDYGITCGCPSCPNLVSAEILFY